MKAEFIGWDIGGAHLKAAALDQKGQVVKVQQFPCPLWKGVESLRLGLQRAIEEIVVGPAYHAVTMTGELVDIFEDRNAGVRGILDVVHQELPLEKTYVFAGVDGLVPCKEVSRCLYAKVASANWLASGLWLAQKMACGLFIDIGTTTTDILLLADKQVRFRGHSDYDRMRYHELIYTGISRTPIMAIADRVPFAGCWVSLVAEVFATTADLYRLTGELPVYADQHPAPDNREKSCQASARRLARMIGRDFDSSEISALRRLAFYLRECHLAKLQSACETQISLCFKEGISFIGAGVGRFLVKRLADRFGSPYIDFNDYVPARATSDEFTPADCAPVVTVALLLKQRLG